MYITIIPIWEERFYTPPPPGNNLRDCKCARFETKASIHHPLWVVVVYRIGLPTISNSNNNNNSNNSSSSKSDNSSNSNIITYFY